LCFSFIGPSRRELREKKREKKAADGLGLSDPAACCFQSSNSELFQLKFFLDCPFNIKIIFI
jgi:hypothetical protein